MGRRPENPSGREGEGEANDGDSIYVNFQITLPQMKPYM
jgi:hypothetical protein